MISKTKVGHLIWCLAALAGPVFTIPQMYNIFVLRQTEGVSFTSWFAYGVLSVVWMVHSYRKDWGVWVNSVLYMVQCFLIAFGVLVM